MKTLIAPALAALLLAACSNDSADTATAPATTDSAASPATATDSAPSATTTGTGNAAAGTVATATGTVESVDPDGGRIVIAHGPVEALQWPAMTMGFEATPEQIQSVQAGQKVEFEFKSQGPKNTVVRIAPAR